MKPGSPFVFLVGLYNRVCLLYMSFVLRSVSLVPKYSQGILNRYASFHFRDMFKSKTQKDAEGISLLINVIIHRNAESTG